MWGGFQQLAQQAKKAAENLDKQLNESVGIAAAQQPDTTAVTTDDDDDDDDALDDTWNDDEIIDTGSTTSNNKKEAVIPEEGAVAEVAVDADNDQTTPKKEEEGWEGDDEVMEFDDDDSPEGGEQGDSASNNNNKPLFQDDATTPIVTEETLEEKQKEEQRVEDEKIITPDNTAKVVVEGSASEVPSGEEKLDEQDKMQQQQQQQEVMMEEIPLQVNDDVNGNKMNNKDESDDQAIQSEEVERVEVVTTTGPPTTTTTESIEQKDVIVENESIITEAAATTIPTTQQEQQQQHNATTTTTIDDGGGTVDQQQTRMFMEQQAEYTRIMEAKMEELQQRLAQREEQLFSKTEQMTTMEQMHENEKQDLIQKVQSTKEEAKRRIQKAKERVEDMERKLKAVTATVPTTQEEINKQNEIITALREEGEKLARKQADYEAAVRAAKTEARELRDQLEETDNAKRTAIEKIQNLELELKKTKDDLSLARQGESQAGKLDTELRQVREESEKRANTILSLEQQVKEYKSIQKELKNELEKTKKGAIVETEQERKKLLKEQNDLVTDLEGKLRTCEREAAVREDALRQEVDELRKRWQDAVRRADALAVDVQSSTAPLLRQLESANKQSRARAAAWAELETQLRSELEDNVIENEKLSKERSEWKTKCTRLERANKEFDTELKQIKGDLHDKTEKVRKLEHQIEEMEAEGIKMKAEWAEVERLANEGVSRVRSEMTRTVVDAEERHRSQVESLESQLRDERNQRKILEEKVANLVDNAGFVTAVATNVTVAEIQSGSNHHETIASPKKKLIQSQGQAEILVGALGYGSDDDDHSDDENDNPTSTNTTTTTGGGGGSFAALEQLTSKLKATKVELNTLRKRLEESEKTREELLTSLAESRNAREKLPLFENKVKELTIENHELTLEVQGLREDIMDVRDMYRTQLNVLLEAQASSKVNGENNNNEVTAETTDNVMLDQEQQSPPPNNEAENGEIETTTITDGEKNDETPNQ